MVFRSPSFRFLADHDHKVMILRVVGEVVASEALNEAFQEIANDTRTLLYHSITDVRRYVGLTHDAVMLDLIRRVRALRIANGLPERPETIHVVLNQPIPYLDQLQSALKDIAGVAGSRSATSIAEAWEHVAPGKVMPRRVITFFNRR